MNMDRWKICLETWSKLPTVFFQMLYGSWKMSRLPQPIITIFGGARISQDSEYARQAKELARKLILSDISIITGGGPGIMQAASCGATESIREKIQARSIGISVAGLLDEPTMKECAQEFLILNEFYARKWLMITFAIGFAIFPGGFGTLDEFAQVITLMQTKKLPGIPVVLIGTHYWNPFVDWLKNSVLQEGLISQNDLSLLRVTDDLDYAFEILKERCEACKIKNR